MPSSAYDSPRLLADIGGTYVRFALETAPGVLEHRQSLRSDEHADFFEAVQHFRRNVGAVEIRHAAVAIANPVSGDRVRMTNYHWEFSIEAMRERLQLETLLVVNDFTALAMALPRLSPAQFRQVGVGQPVDRSVMGLIGAGTGLGVSGLIPANEGWIALGTEGGHASFSPRNEDELAILRFAWRFHSHVSFERLLSGPGIELIHRALGERAGRQVEPIGAPEITRRALEGGDPLCVSAIDVFCEILGTAAANLAVTQGALGGIYIGGGIVPRLGTYFDRSRFRDRFEDKGRFSDYMRGIPTYVITADDATLSGVAAILGAQLDRLDAGQGATILGQIRRARDKLSPAEQRVADHILAHPRQALNEPIGQLAKASEVSQPTVIRFCRSLGCDGLSDFKLRLASGLTGTMPVTHTQVTQADTTLELGDKVLANTASAILQVRDHLNRRSIEEAVKLLGAADRVEFYAVGHFGSVAEDAQFKFLRMGIPAAAYTAPRLQTLAANLVHAGVVAVVISGSGRIDELNDVVRKVRERGGKVVAITASQSPLARDADVSLIVDHVEDSASQVPMISRILHLLMIDILVVGVTVGRDGQALPELGDAASRALDEPAPATDGKAGPKATRAGIGAALAHLTAHGRTS